MHINNYHNYQILILKIFLKKEYLLNFNVALYSLASINSFAC